MGKTGKTLGRAKGLCEARIAARLVTRAGGLATMSARKPRAFQFRFDVAITLQRRRSVICISD
jgi:hypothetical protein